MSGIDRNSDRGIATAGVHVPRFRLDADELTEAWGHSQAGGVEQKAVPGADEDALTMGLAAAADALDGGDVDRETVSFLGIATTTPPMAEEELAGRYVRALGLSPDVETVTSTQSPASGVDALRTAIGADGPALAVVADAPRGEPADADHALGGGAVAFLVTDDAPVTAIDAASHADEYPGIRFRQAGEREVESLDITTYQRNAMRESVTAALEGLDVDLETVAAAAVHQPNGGLPYRLTGDVPLDPETVSAGTVVDRIGDAGAATVPLGLLAALESDAVDGDDVTVAVPFGGGGRAAALAFAGGLDSERTAAIDDAGETIDYSSYLRERGYVVSGEVAGGGANVSLPSWVRSLDARYRLEAGKCPECGAYAFPPEGACPACHALVEFEAVEMPREGVVTAKTTIGQGGAPPEFVAQQDRDGAFGVVIVEIPAEDDEGSITLPAQLTDCDPEDVEVGDAVRATVRRIYEQEGVPRYGSKFTPVE